MKYQNLSRRDFLAAAALATSAIYLPSIRRAQATSIEIDPRLAKILSSTIAVDMHNHVYPLGTEPHPHHDTKKEADVLSLAEELKHSGFTAVCASFVLDFAPSTKAGESRDNYLKWLTAMDVELSKGSIHRALNLKDLQRAHDLKTTTIVQSVEGAQFIEGELERVEDVYKRGLRHLQLLHERDDLVSPLGDVNSAAAHLGGLTTFGAKVIKECNRLGILLDLAHASHETLVGALKASSQPIIVSHTCLDTRKSQNEKMDKMMKPRLISKDDAKLVADAGGVIGVWTHLADSLKDFVESTKAMVDAVGIDHVGIGSDTDLLNREVGHGTNKAWEGMSEGFFTAVAGEMLQQGFKPEEIAKIGGGNFCRVFDAATKGHS